MSVRDLHSFWEWGRKIICVGRNYAEHARELGNPLPGAEPLLFLKPPSAYLRPGSAIRPPRYSRRLQPEVELGLVLAKGGSSIPQEEAMGYLGGYALCLDMTARDTQEECKRKGHPWTLAKAFDCSCPVSDFIPKDKLPDPHRLTLWLKVNGQLRQQGHTSQMIFPIPHLISYISGIIRLEEGDLILTGTPAGVSDVQEDDELQADHSCTLQTAKDLPLIPAVHHWTQEFQHKSNLRPSHSAPANKPILDPIAKLPWFP